MWLNIEKAMKEPKRGGDRRGPGFQMDHWGRVRMGMNKGHSLNS